MRMLNLAVRFVLEVCALIALGVTGWQAPGPWPLRLLLALVLVGHPSWALALAVAYAVNVSVVFALHQRAS